MEIDDTSADDQFKQRKPYVSELNGLNDNMIRNAYRVIFSPRLG
jgi:hypothetical protein